MTFEEFLTICKNGYCNDCEFFGDFCLGAEKECDEDEDTSVLMIHRWNSLSHIHKKIYLKYSRKEKLKKLLS